MNDEPYLHRDDVPEDARRNVRHLVVGGSESEGVVAWDNFLRYESLERLGFREGTQWIDDHAFADCSLSEMTLPDGLRGIGHWAFWGHHFRQITIPSSVREIGYEAFANGKVLREVTLAGGMVLVGRNAFRGCVFVRCPQLQSIAIPSMAIVVEEGGNGGNGRAAVVTRGTIALDQRRRSPNRMILTSPYLASMHSEDDDTRVSDVTRVKDAINRIAGDRPMGEGPLDLGAGDAFGEEDWIHVPEGANRIRSRFLGLLSAHRRARASILRRAPLWESAGGGVEPGVVENILSFLGGIEG